ncbi:MAG: hypothetical protein R3C11_13725 [Planctomycetaceae bacterium]
MTKLTYQFNEVINDDPLGIGAFNSTVHFDDFSLTSILDGPLKTPFPFSMDNGDDLEGTNYVINGNWTVEEDFAIGNSIGLSNPRGITLFNTAHLTFRLLCRHPDERQLPGARYCQQCLHRL